MTFKVSIDQAEAIRRGINAPYSTGKVSLDVCRLSAGAREFLAAAVVDAHDLTGRWKIDGIYGYIRVVTAIQAELEAAIEAAADQLRRAKEEREAQADAALEERLRGPDIERPVRVDLVDREVRKVHGGAVEVRLRCPAILNYCPPLEYVSPAMRERIERIIEQRREEFEAAKAAAFEAARPELERLAAERETAAMLEIEEKESRAELRAANARLTREFVREHGVADQVERFEAAVLPDEEFTALVESHLFAEVADFVVYAQICQEDLEHSDECYGTRPKYKRELYEGPYSATQWENLHKVLTTCRDHLREGARCTVYRHLGWCEECHGSDDIATERFSVLVEIDFAGETYTRRLAL
jgi:hypothetical protein